MRIIDNIAPTSEPFHFTIQIFSFPELFAMRGELDCKLDPKYCVRLCQESGCYTST